MASTASTLPTFAALFGSAPRVTADAPGRVNLIGEYTDISGGFVLPVALPLRTTVELALRSDSTVRAWTANRLEPEGTLGIGTYSVGAESPGRGWLDYLQGLTSVLNRDGWRVGGFDLRVASEVPPGSGLASSAALTVAVVRALRAALSLPLDDQGVARVAHQAETEFVGAPVGVMDPMAASLAATGWALFLDTRSLQWEHLPLGADAELLVIDSGVTHRHAAGGYRQRRAECDAAACEMGVDQLRELDLADLPRLAKLPAVLARRARHVVTENGRVLAAVRALREGDGAALGRLLWASHRSLAEDFEVSTAELDLLVELARAEREVLGARLTGGGFGGSVVLLTTRGAARGVGQRIVADYGWRTGRIGTVLVPAV